MNKIIKNILLVFTIFLGIFIFFYGGYDDSPGAQGLGLLIIISSIFTLIKNRKKNPL